MAETNVTMESLEGAKARSLGSEVKSMNVFRFETQIWLPRPRSEIFAFFSDAANLQQLTPSWVHFKILSPLPIAMHPGTLIDYRIRIHGIPVRWKTEISKWEPPFRFVDTQLRGPYRQWIHEHQFEEVDGGTTMFDRVDYAVWGGALLNRLWVRKEIEKIFDYRRQVMTELFGTRSEALPMAG